MSLLTRLSLANRAVISLLCLLVVGVGIYAIDTLKQELMPPIQTPGASIIASYPGATPELVEREVTEPVESAARGVAGVTSTQSTSSANMAQIMVQWQFGESADEIQGQLRTAIDGLDLPENVDPELVAYDLDAIPVVGLGVSSDLDQQELAEALDTVAIPKLNAIPGVGDASVSGVPTTEVAITLKPKAVDKHGVDPAQLQELFSLYENQVPAGSLDSDGRRLAVEVGTTLDAVKRIAGLWVQGEDGPVQLRDIADVSEKQTDARSISRVNGKPALSLNVTKTSEGNTVEVSHAVRDALPAISNEIGGNTEFNLIFDQAPFIEDSIEDLSTEGGLGLAMAVLVILLFLLSFRSTVITAMSIPLSLLIGLIGLYLGGFTLNMMTLAALTVSVGRVVDDSIVVIENIKRHASSGAPFGPDLIIGAVKEVAGAITASTLTTVAVFGPVGLVSGSTGELLRPFSVTVAIALLASLVVSLTIVPVLSLWFMRPSRRQLSRQRAATEAPESTETRLQRGYLPILRWTLRHPVITIVAAVLVFVLTAGLATSLRTDFLGQQGNQGLSITQTMPAGTDLTRTDQASRKVEQVLEDDPDVTVYQTAIGSSGGGDLFTAGATASEATFTVSLDEDSDSGAALARLRDRLAGISGAGEIEVVGTDSTGGGELEVEVAGQDAQAVAKGAEQVSQMMAGLDGVTSASSDLTEQETKLRVKINEKKAAQYGMNQATIGQAVNQVVAGLSLGTAVIDGRELDVKLFSQKPVTSPKELAAIKLPITQKQTTDAQQRASDRIEDEQEELSAEQEAQAEEQAAAQEQELRDQRAELADQVDDLLAQLDELRNTPVTTTPPAGAESPSGASGPGGGAPAGPDPAAARAAQIEQLEEQIDQLQEQIDATDESLTEMEEQRADQEAQTQRTEDLQERSENVTEIKGSAIRLSEVADLVEAKTPATITRVDGVRTATVTAAAPEGDLGTTTAALQDGIAQLDLPSGVTASIGGVSQQQDDAFQQLLLAMGIAIAAVYMIMVATFRSLLQPLILLVSIPFAATGAIGLLLATGSAIDVAGMIGMLMLIGIVVTNAIVLIDLINQYRSAGASVDDAVIHGARLRLRPIIMTAAATIMALVPMAIGLTGGGIFISRPLAIVVIGGLLSSTVLTLILVPVLYHFVEQFRQRRRDKREARAAARAAADEPAGDDPGPQRSAGADGA